MIKIALNPGESSGRKTDESPEREKDSSPLTEEYIKIRSSGDLDATIPDDKINEILSDRSYASLAASPAVGSILHFVLRHGVSKREVENYFRDKVVKEVLLASVGDDTSLPTYMLYRLVLPHGAALTVGDAVIEVAKKRKIDEYSVLSSITGKDISKRSDVFSLLKTTMRKHPRLLDVIPDFLK